MLKDVKNEFIYVTYKRYLDELNEVLPKKDKKLMKANRWLSIINAIMVSILVILEVFYMFNPFGEKLLYFFLGLEVVLLLISLVVALKVDRFAYSKEAFDYKFKAMNKIIPKDKYSEMKEMLSCEKTVSVYSSVKDFLIKIVSILSICFGVIKPILEQLVQPFVKRLVILSEQLADAPLGQLFTIVSDLGAAAILILIGILLFWTYAVVLLKIYDKLIKSLHLTSYSKSCELLTICQLRIYYEKEEA